MLAITFNVEFLCRFEVALMA